MLAQVDLAFDESDIRQKQLALGKEWYYQLCALPLQRGSNLLLGLNWGVDAAARHLAQAAPPSPAEVAHVATWSFIARSRRYLDRHFGPLTQANYFNVCPFRTPDVSYLSPRDWQLSLERFFLETIDYLPPHTLILGTTAVDPLEGMRLADYRTLSVLFGGRAVNARTGTIRGRAKTHRFAALPHPNNKITNDARDAIWAKVFRAGAA